MTRAVQFDAYGGIDVLEVRDVPRPVPGAGEVLIEVRSAGINISEAVLRSGALHYLWPLTFPSGQGSDLAGVVADSAPASTISRWATRSSDSPTGGPATPST
jgi:NADPH:quinone reductase-like Zn-dependent oxidoreductase